MSLPDPRQTAQVCPRCKIALSPDQIVCSNCGFYVAYLQSDNTTNDTQIPDAAKGQFRGIGASPSGIPASNESQGSSLGIAQTRKGGQVSLPEMSQSRSRQGSSLGISQSRGDQVQAPVVPPLRGGLLSSAAIPPPTGHQAPMPVMPPLRGGLLSSALPPPRTEQVQASIVPLPRTEQVQVPIIPQPRMEQVQAPVVPQSRPAALPQPRMEQVQASAKPRASSASRAAKEKPVRKKRATVIYFVTVVVVIMVVAATGLHAAGISLAMLTPHAAAPPTIGYVLPKVTPLFADSFVNDASGWNQQSSSGSYQVTVGNGTLTIQLNKNKLLWEPLPGTISYSDFTLTVNAVLNKGDQNNGYGLYIRGVPGPQSDLDTYYRFELYGDGSYAIFKGILDQNGQSTATKVVNYTLSPAIQKQGKLNHIMLIANGTSLSFIVNGQLLKTFVDTSYASGSIALFASNLPEAKPGVQVQFSQLALYPRQIAKPS